MPLSMHELNTTPVLERTKKDTCLRSKEFRKPLEFDLRTESSKTCTCIDQPSCADALVEDTLNQEPIACEISEFLNVFEHGHCSIKEKYRNT